jgi:hypothetical protein
LVLVVLVVQVYLKHMAPMEQIQYLILSPQQAVVQADQIVLLVEVVALVVAVAVTMHMLVALEIHQT